ncbi:hypothetical protein H6F76_28355 [Leptolyngbya sp. FACHB-321]|nr:hypothetical protein [Leptolyngbya sp. FACHB-321]
MNDSLNLLYHATQLRENGQVSLLVGLTVNGSLNLPLPPYLPLLFGWAIWMQLIVLPR